MSHSVIAEQHQQDGKDEDEEGEGVEEDEEVDVEVEVLLAAVGRCPQISAGTLQRGIPVHVAAYPRLTQGPRAQGLPKGNPEPSQGWP